ncbi:MAG: hypothetical protein Q4E09_05915 [Eubacteriales bacterium]|nr:hypothetical protein [Eubacteriales bacterium]
MPINELITLILQGVVVPLLIWGIYEVRNYLTAKVKNATARRILVQATDAAEKAVRETMQTYVDSIKDTPEWSVEAQRIAFDKAKHSALEILGEEGWSLLQSVVGDANAYLTAAIESAVADIKREEYYEPAYYLD